MTQLNIHMTAAFEQDLQRFMKLRHIKTKAEAVRVAVKESLEHAGHHGKVENFSAWVGLGKQAPENKKLKFRSDDELWK